MPLRVKPAQITGLTELNNAMLQLRGAPRKVAENAGYDIAKMIATTAAARVPTGPGINGHARDSIKAARERAGARVDAGGPRFPYYPWLDFGGTIRKSAKKPVKRAFFKSGRYVWNVYEQYYPKFKDQLTKALTEAARAAGLDVKD